MGLVNLKPKTCKQLPGTEIEMLIAEIDDLTNDPRTVAQMGAAVPTYVLANGDETTIGEAFTYKMDTTVTPNVPSGKWYRFKIVMDSGEIMADTVGDRGFKAFQNGFKGMIKGMDAATRAWVEKVTLSCNGVIIAIPERTTGDYNILGSISAPIDIDFKGKGGQKAGDKYGFDVDVKDNFGRVYRTYPKALGLNVAPIV